MWVNLCTISDICMYNKPYLNIMIFTKYSFVPLSQVDRHKLLCRTKINVTVFRSLLLSLFVKKKIQDIIILVWCHFQSLSLFYRFHSNLDTVLMCTPSTNECWRVSGVGGCLLYAWADYKSVVVFIIKLLLCVSVYPWSSNYM